MLNLANITFWKSNCEFRADAGLAFHVDRAAMFPDEAVRYVDYVKNSTPAGGGGETLLPGEPEARSRAQRLQQGVPVPDETWSLILDTARSVGVDTDRVQRAAGGHR